MTTRHSHLNLSGGLPLHVISAKISGNKIFSLALSFMTYCCGRLPNCYQMAWKCTKQLPFLDPRAATETCVTKETKLFQIPYVCSSVLLTIKLYFQKFDDNIAIHSSANE